MYRNLPLEQALDAAGEVIFMTDLAGVFTFVNREFECLYGYSAPEVVGIATPHILNAQRTVEADAAWRTRLMRGDRLREQLRNQARDGRFVDVDVSANAVRDDFRQIVGFIEVQRDVTAKLRVIAELTRSEARYRALAESASDEIFIVDARNQFEYLNSSAMRHLGAESESVIGRCVRDCFGPVMGPVLERKIDETRASLTPAYAEHRIQFSTGPRWMGTWIQPIVTGNSVPDGSVMGIARDVTRQHEMAELLQRQNLLLNAVIAASPAGVMLLNADRWSCDITNDAIRDFGAPALSPGVTLADGWPDAAPQLVPILEAALHSAAPVHGEMKLEGSALSGAGPRERRFTVNVAPVNLPRRRTSLLVMLMDVTDRLQLEEQFLQAQKMEAIGRLAGGVAHDFNNLLTPILGYSELLVNTLAEDDRRRGDLEEVCRAARSAAALTRQLLTFSRKQVTAPTVLNLNTVLDDVDKMLRRSIGEDIDIVDRHEPEIGFIRADRNQLEQVIMNLVVNARDAMPHGGALTLATTTETLTHVERGARRPIPPGEYVVLSISDTGTGMTPEVLSHLFEPFYTTKAFGKGTGLGLSTVHGIVAESGGYIAVASVPDHGTTFTMYFPHVEALAAGTSTVVSEAPASDEALSGHETVLIVEDHDALRNLAERMLTGLGYCVLTASNAAEALRTSDAFSQPIDVLLTDIVMPGDDGLVLAQCLTARRPEAHVVYMSGYSGRDLDDRQADLHGGRLLQKPFSRLSLARAVRESLTVVPAIALV